MSNVTDVILVKGAGLDKPLVYVKIEQSTEEPNDTSKIDATADTSWDDDWDYWGDWEDAPEDRSCGDPDCGCN